MGSIQHALNKFLLERAASAALISSRQAAADVPPPYTATADPNPLNHPYLSLEDNDSSDSDNDSDTDPDPVTLTINAGTSVQGSNNIISLAATSPLADATRFSTLLLAAVAQLNARAAQTFQHQQATAAAHGGGAKTPLLCPSLKVNLTINAGIQITGDRNIVGHRPVAATAGVVGTKRKAETEADGGRAGKRV